MSEDAILQYLKSIDARTGRMETSITATMQKHQEEDDAKHGEMRKDIDSLLTSRTAARAGITALALGGTGGAAKLGFLDKIISMIGGQAS